MMDVSPAALMSRLCRFSGVAQKEFAKLDAGFCCKTPCRQELPRSPTWIQMSFYPEADSHVLVGAFRSTVGCTSDKRCFGRPDAASCQPQQKHPRHTQTTWRPPLMAGNCGSKYIQRDVLLDLPTVHGFKLALTLGCETWHKQLRCVNLS